MPAPTFGYLDSKGSSSSAPTFDILPEYKPPKKKEGLTARQLALIALAQERDPKFSLGKALKSVGKHALNPVLWTFDKLLRPSYAVAGAVDEGFRGEDNKFRVLNALRGAYAGLSGKEKRGFGEVMENYGILEGHRKLRGLAGFGADVVTDPLLLLTTAAAPVTGGASVAAYAALKAGTTKASQEAIEKAALAAGRKVMSEGADEFATGILKKAGPKYRHRAALSEHMDYLKTFDEAGVMPPTGGLEEAKLNILRASAAAEERSRTRYVPQARLGTQKHSIPITPVYIGGMRVVPHLPKMSAIAARSIPGVSRLVNATGERLVPGFRREELHAMEISRLHVAEQNVLVHRDNLERILGNVGSKLHEEEKLGALHLMEQPLKRGKGKWKAITQVKRHGSMEYVVNDKYIDHLKKQGWIDDVQEDFIRKYFTATQYLYHRDMAHGIKYKHLGDEGRMYVPHVRKSDGTPLEQTQHQFNLFSEAGFQKGRRVRMSVAQISEAVKRGELPRDIVTDPEQLLAHTARSRAEKQADTALINSVQDAVGIPRRIVDRTKVSQAHDKALAAEAQHQAALRQAADAETRLQAKHELLRQDIIEDYDDKLAALKRKYNKTKFGPKSKTKAARLAKIQNEISRAELARDQELLALGKNKHPRLSVKEEQKALETAAKARDDAAKKAQSAIRAWNRAQRGRANPAFSKSAHREVPKAVDEFGNSYGFTPDVAASLTRLQKVLTGDEKTIDDFAKGYAKWMSKWKILVTTVNPGYRFRNTATDFWNMYVAGVPARQIPVYGGKAAKVMRDAKNSDPRALKVIYEASSQGVMSGLFAGDIQAVAAAMKYAGSKRSLAKDKHFIQLATKIAQDVNRNAENWARLAHYLYQRQARGLSVADAALKVKAAHFDYEDLTPFEQRILKKVFPFYTWTRKNIPYQVKAILQNPGRYATFPKMANEAEYAAGEGEGDIPDYLSENFAFKVPFGKNKYFSPQFGVSDIAVFQGPGEVVDRFKQMLTPAAKLPAEMLLNKSFLTGAEIAGTHPRNPVSPLGAALLRPFPGSNVGQTERDGITGPGANPYYAHLLGQIPMGRVGGVATGGIKGKQTNNAALLSWLTGLSTTTVDPTKQAEFTRRDLEKEVDKLIKGARDEGRYPKPKERKKSEIDKMLEKMLKGGE